MITNEAAALGSNARGGSSTKLLRRRGKSDLFRQLIYGSTKMAGVWDEIYIEAQVAAGVARERVTDPSYEKGKIHGGRWFEDIETNEIWRLVPPDFPFKGLWEKVDINLPKL